MSIDRVEIGPHVMYCGDCLEILPTLAAGSVDAVVTDPPYFMPASHYQSRIGWQRCWSDASVLTHWWGQICDAFRSRLKDTAHALVFSNADAYAAFYPAMFNRWAKLNCLVWNKMRPGLGRLWRHQHELVIAARDETGYMPDDGVLRADVIECPAAVSSNRRHPVEKPAEMLAELIHACAPGEGVVCDPFMGGGTTGKACATMGRKFIGIEIERKYFDIACKRLTAECAQGKLFEAAI